MSSLKPEPASPSLPWPRPPDAEGVARLVRVSLGLAPADAVIRGCRVVNVFDQSVGEPASLALAGEYIAAIGPEQAGWLGPETEVFEAGGRFLLPGLIDAHTHLDSIFQLGPYVAPAVASGNTCAISETAMIAGAWGAAGVRAFIDDAAGQPMRLFFSAPPLVPPFPELETSAGMGLVEFEELLARADFLGVGEAYWPAVTDLDPRIGPEFAAAHAMGKTMEGHAAGAHGAKLAAYAAAGVSSCHEAITGEEALARLSLGMAVQVRQGFVRKEMDQVVPALLEAPDTRQVMLVTDLADLGELMADGAMNPLLAKAVELGAPPALATAWCSLNPARYFGLNRIGGLAPGWVADMVLVDDLVSFRARAVWLGGALVAEDGRLVVPAPQRPYPAAALATMKNPPISRDDLRVAAAGPEAEVAVCQVLGDTITKAASARLPVADGNVPPCPERDVQKLAHINRHSKDLKMAVGFASGWGLKRGALATTLEWDTTNLIVVGADEDDMVTAANRVREMGGGLCVAAGGRVLAELALPACGVVSPLPLAEIKAAADACEAAARELGCPLPRPFLTAQTFCFTGLPFLRLTDRGLVDVRRRAWVPVVG